MDLTKLGNNTWSEPGVTQISGLKGFTEDAADAKLTSSVSDLLNLTRQRTGRQFVATVTQSQNIPNLKLDKIKMTNKSPVTNKTVKSSRALASNTIPHNVVEQPATRGEIHTLELELQERIKIVMCLEEAEIEALESGNLFQPHKDKLVFIKNQLLNELNSSDERYENEPWLHRIVACQALTDVCDDVTGKLVDVVAVTSNESGNVLRRLRSTYSQSFTEMRSSWRLLYGRYLEMEQEIAEGRQQMADLTEKLRDSEQRVREDVQGEIDDMRKFNEQERIRDREVQRQTEFQMEQMSETIKNLNGIFKTMQSDVDAARSADLLSKCHRLEKQVADLTSKCSIMEQVKKALDEKVVENAALVKERETLRSENQKLTKTLQRRDDTVGELMEREALRSAEMEKMKQMAAMQSEADETLELSEPPTSLLCIKCKKALDDLTNLRSVILGPERGDERMQCQAFRVLLPNLRGRRPHRTMEWVRHCMRAILASKTRDCISMRPIRTDVTRMPEFTYAWFDPDVHGLKVAKDIQTAAAHADEDRWGFYYGVKTLALDDPEAKLFWALLDEAQGEDGLTFVCYSLSVAMSMGGGDLWRQLGDSFVRCNNCSARSPVGSGVRPVVWMPLHVAKDAVRHILARALKAQVLELLDAIDALKEVPEFEDPTAEEAERSDEISTAFEDPASLPEVVAALTAADNDSVETPPAKEPTHINLFIWLRLMLAKYHQEQCHRAAAIRLMFDTASLGALTPAPAAAYGSTATSGAGGGKEDGSHVEFPQFQAVMKTLYRSMPLTDMAALYAQCYEEGHRKVTAAVFMKVAEQRALFSRAMQFAPLPLLVIFPPPPPPKEVVPEPLDPAVALLEGEAAETNTDAPKELLVAPIVAIAAEAKRPATSVLREQEMQVMKLERESKMIRAQLGALVHRKMRLLAPVIATLMEQVPEKWRAMLTEASVAVTDSLQDAYQQGRKKKIGSGGLSDTVKLPDLQGPAFAMDGLQPYVLYRRLLSLSLAARSFSDNPLLPSDLIDSVPNSEPVSRVTDMKLKRVETLLEHMELALVGRSKGRATASESFESVRRTIAARRIQELIKRFFAADICIPRTLRRYIRSGYLSGRGQTKTRRVYNEPWWAQVAVADVYAFKVEYDRRAVSLGLAPISLGAATVGSLLKFWGNVEAAERALHDLCLAVRTYQHAVPRLKLFAIFLGGNWSDSDPLDPSLVVSLQTEAAVSRYLDLVVALHGASTGEVEDQAEQFDEREKGVAVGLIAELFPTTYDPMIKSDRKEAWLVSKARVNGATARWGVKQRGVSAQVISEAIGKVRTDAGQLDADDALWAVMTSWAKSMAMIRKQCTLLVASDEKKQRRGGDLKQTSASQSDSAALVKKSQLLAKISVHKVEEMIKAVISSSSSVTGLALDLNPIVIRLMTALCGIGGSGSSTTMGDWVSAGGVVEGILRDAMFWNLNSVVPIVHDSSAEEEDAVLETGLPKYLHVQVQNSCSLASTLQKQRKAWQTYKEPIQRFLSQVELLVQTRIASSTVDEKLPVVSTIQDDRSLASTLENMSTNAGLNILVARTRMLTTQLELSLEGLEASRIAGAAIGQTKRSAFSNSDEAAAAAAPALTVELLAESGRCLHMLHSCVSELVGSARGEVDYPKDTWKAGRKMHLEKASVYRS